MGVLHRLLLGLMLSPVAWASVPVELPPGEATDSWEEPLMLAGLALGAPGEGPYVVARPVGDGWQLQVRDRAGGLREVSVARPGDAAAREELAFLAASMLQPAVLTSMAPVEPAAPSPEPVQKPRPRPAPAQPDPEPEVEVVAAVEAAPATATVTPLQDDSAWLVVSAGTGLRISTATRPGAGVAVGVGVGATTSSRLSGGLELHGWFPTVLADYDWNRSEGATEAWLLGSWAPLQTLPLSAGLGVGVSSRAYRMADAQVDRIAVPVGAAHLTLSTPLRSALGLEVSLRGQLDLRSTEIILGDGATRRAPAAMVVAVSGTRGLPL